MLKSDEKYYKQAQKVNDVRRRELIAKATPQELIVKAFLEANNVDFIFQKGFLKPFHRIVDFYIPKGRGIGKWIIEIDGLYHESIPDRDTNKDRSAKWDRNINTMRITNAQVDNGEYRAMLTKALNIK